MCNHQARSPHQVPGPHCQQQDGVGQVELACAVRTAGLRDVYCPVISEVPFSI